MSATLMCENCHGPMTPSKGGSERRWCSNRCRKQALYSNPCPICGSPMTGSEGRGPNAPKRCRKCQAQLQGDEARDRWRSVMEPKVNLILGMIEDGRTNAEIADEIDSTPASVAQFIQRLRSRGYEIADRRSRARAA